MKGHLVVKFGSAKAVTGLAATSASGKVAGIILGDGQSALSIRTEKDGTLPGIGDTGKGGGLNNAAGNALVGLPGTGTTSGQFVAPLDARRYEEFAVGTLGSATEMMLARLKQATGG